MNTTISNNGLPNLHQTASSQSGSQSQAPASTANTESSSRPVGSSDKVNLTDSARALQEAARAGDGAPVDSSKVDKIRQSLAAGTYQVNPERIADRLLSLDGQIAGSGSVSTGS